MIARCTRKKKSNTCQDNKKLDMDAVLQTHWQLNNNTQSELKILNGYDKCCTNGGVVSYLKKLRDTASENDDGSMFFLTPFKAEVLVKSFFTEL